MKPRNTKERKQSFSRFLILFAVLLAVIGVAVFFGIRLPIEENGILKKQIKLHDQEMVFNKNFISTMIEAENLLDSLNLNPQNAGLMDGRITQKIQSLDAMIANNDTMASKNLYLEVIKILNKSQADKSALRAAGSKDSLVAKYNAKIEELNLSLTKWQDAYKQLEMQNLILRQGR